MPKTVKNDIKTWENAQKWEFSWHGNCINSFNEERKQFVYADKMGLILKPTPKTPFNFDLNGKSILDIGGGAYSLLLKCTNLGTCAVVDPLLKVHPAWIKYRYNFLGITQFPYPGEKLLEKNSSELTSLKGCLYDEVWIYNVLEHTYDPKKVIKNALALGRIVRIFEWIDTEENIGHPQVLTSEKLDKWLGGEGKVEMINQSGAVGKAYYGVFKGKNYEKI